MTTGNSLADRWVRWAFRHWLALLNTLVFLYGGLPWLSPLLYHIGYPQLGHGLFALYSPFCHQNPARSFAWLGYQVAFCHREAAMYTALFVGGLLFALVRHRWNVPPIRLRTVGYLLLPMMLDGTTHLVNDLLPGVLLRSADHSIGSLNWWLRMSTGLLFAVAMVLGFYTRLEQTMDVDANHMEHTAIR
jgi:uncharacterized membrane protein